MYKFISFVAGDGSLSSMYMEETEFKKLEAIHKASKLECSLLRVEEHPDLAKKYCIRAVPCVVQLDEEDNVVSRMIGIYDDLQLEAFLTTGVSPL